MGVGINLQLSQKIDFAKGVVIIYGRGAVELTKMQRVRLQPTWILPFSFYFYRRKQILGIFALFWDSHILIKIQNGSTKEFNMDINMWTALHSVRLERIKTFSHASLLCIIDEAMKRYIGLHHVLTGSHLAYFSQGISDVSAYIGDCESLDQEILPFFGDFGKALV